MFTFGPIGWPQWMPFIGIAVLLAGWIVVAVTGTLARTRRAPAAPDGTAAVAVTRLTKRYRKTVALDDVSFTLEPGRVLALLGPNGAGKTTLLRIIAGLTEPDAGAVSIFGHPIVPGAPVLSRVGLTIEEPGFAPQLTGRENLAMLWEISGRDPVQARIDDVVELTGLSRAADREAGTYSQGTRQRLALAQAMLGFPELLILDEPTNGLDPDQIWELAGVLRRYAASGRTVVVASHLLSEVSDLCTDCVVIRSGTVAWWGPMETTDEPATIEVGVDDPAAAADLLAQPLAALAPTAPGGPQVVAAPPGAVTIALGPARIADVLAAVADAGIAVRSLRTPDRLAAIYRASAGDPEAAR